VTVTDDVPPLGDVQLQAAVGAAAEALTNSVKHGHARRVVVFADVDEETGGLFLSIKDDGDGFDPAAVVEGVGLAQSIRGRVERAGGSVAVTSAPGDGTEVRIGLPSGPTPAGRARRRVRSRP